MIQIVLCMFFGPSTQNKYGEWRVANTNNENLIFQGTNYYVIDPGQSRHYFTFATSGSDKIILTTNILGDTWLIQNKSYTDEGSSHFDPNMDEGLTYITDETGPHIPSRKDSAVFRN